MKDLYVIRHCKTINNINNIVSGQSNCPLVDNFVDFSTLSLSQPYILICSPLERCVNTAQILKMHSNLDCVIRLDYRLKERNMGIFQGKSRFYLAQKYPDYFPNGKFKHFLSPPDGESYLSFQLRIYLFILNLQKILPDNNIIICSHNQTLRMITAIIKSITYAESPSYPNGVVIKIL